MSKTETLSIDLLRLDGDTQSRVDVNSETVEEYAELIAADKTKWPFGPLTVYHSGSVYYVADGFHRTLAAIKAGRASVPCDVKNGTARDARFFGMKANDEHGLRMSSADRRINVVWMLDNYTDMTQANIAANAGVGVRTVERIVAERKPTPVNPPMAGSSSSETSNTGVPSPPPTKPTPKQRAAAKAKAKAKAAAAKEKAKVDAAAAKAVKDKEKAEAAAEKARAKAEAAAEKLKAKEEAAAAKAKEKAAAKEAKAKAKLAVLPKDEQAKAIKNLIQQHINKTVRLIDDLSDVRPVSNTAKMAIIRTLQSITLW
jgi:flagellar biosynthesis GTPase FlhF